MKLNSRLTIESPSLKFKKIQKNALKYLIMLVVLTIGLQVFGPLKPARADIDGITELMQKDVTFGTSPTHNPAFPIGLDFSKTINAYAIQVDPDTNDRTCKNIGLWLEDTTGSNTYTNDNRIDANCMLYSDGWNNITHGRVQIEPKTTPLLPNRRYALTLIDPVEHFFITPDADLTWSGTLWDKPHRNIHSFLTTPLGTMAAPIFTPPSGTVHNGDVINFSSTDVGFTIHYTTDGSTPTSSSPSGNSYTIAQAHTTLRAISVRDGYLNSPETSQTYSYPSHSLSYNGNNNTSGTAPGPASITETDSIQVPGAGDLVKTGNNFASWNTAADGTGTAYAANSSFTMGTNDVTLYAQWSTKPSHTLTYNGNGNTGGSVPGVISVTEDLTAIVAGKGTLVKTGNSFAGWNTVANGTGTAYGAGSTFTMATNDVTLYAQWTTIPTHSLSYNGNGSTGGTAPVTVTIAEGSSTTVSDVGTLVKTGNNFAGWNTTADGTGTAFAAGSTFTMATNDIILYAQWTATDPGTGNPGGGTTDNGTTNLPNTGPFANYQIMLLNLLAAIIIEAIMINLFGLYKRHAQSSR